MKKKVLFVIISVIFIVVIASYFSFRFQKKLIDETSPKILSELIIPYSELIKNKEYEKAYNDMTTESYKERHTLKDYLQSQKQNNDYFGNLVAMKLTSGIFIKMFDKENKWIYRGTIDYIASKKSTKFTIDVALENGVFKIARTYPSQITIRNSVPMIF